MRLFSFVLLFSFSYAFLALKTSAQLHYSRKGARLALRAPAAVNVTRATLDRIVRTYEWNQYSFQAAACLNTPNFYTDCSRVYPGYGIPSLGNVNVERRQYGYQYQYIYSQLTWYGFGRTNYTSVEPKLINITAQAMYYTCQANNTCARAYNSTAGIQTSLMRMIGQNSAQIRALLPADNSKTWVPSTQFTSFTPFFTTFPDPAVEVLGLHESVVLGLQNKTSSQVQAIYLLKQRLSGGAAMYESLMNHLALIGLDPYSNKTTYQRRAESPAAASAPIPIEGSEQLGIIGGSTASFDQLREKRIALMKELAQLRGPQRSRISELSMANNLQALGVTKRSLVTGITFNGVNLMEGRADCGAIAQVASNVDAINTFINNCCLATSPIRDFVSFKSNWKTWQDGPFAKTSTNIGGALTNHFTTYGDMLQGMCNLFSSNTPCYPDPNIWIQAAQAVQTVSSIYSLLSQVLTVSPTPLGLLNAINLGCDISGFVKTAYTTALNCCKGNCASPGCVAASAACAFGGPGC